MPTRRFTDQVLSCGHCGNRGRMDIKGEHKVTEGEECETGDGGTQFNYMGDSLYQMVACQACNGAMLIRAYGYDDTVGKFTITYPAVVQYPSTVPATIVEALNDAQNVRHVSANAYGAMAGRAIERICLENGCSKGTMNESIDALATANIIPKQLASLAHKLRIIRNFGAHGGITNLTANEVPVVEAILKAIVEYIYFAPELLAKAAELVKRLKT